MRKLLFVDDVRTMTVADETEFGFVTYAPRTGQEGAPKMSDTYRRLKPADSARIKCQGAHALAPVCPANATICNTVEWDTGNTKGISFFYHCDEHTKGTVAACVTTRRTTRSRHRASAETSGTAVPASISR